MIIKNNKGYETHSFFPNKDWYNDGSVLYVVDETTQEGKILAKKIKQYAPFYRFVLDSKGELIDITPVERPILPEFNSPEEVNFVVVNKIREKYSADEEAKALRTGIVDSKSKIFIDYNNYVKECILWGENKKKELGFEV